MVQKKATDNNSRAPEELRFPYRIASRYHCKGYLGSGGSGLVFKAWDDLLQRMVAIKFIKNPSFITRQRLVEEARSLARVNHPSLCSVYDIGEPVDENSSLFMVMELIEGPRISELAGQIDVETAVRVLNRLAEGVAQLHSAGLVHNDINPANVIIKHGNSDEPIPTLIDLSIADRQSYLGRNRHTGFGVTPLFGAPEQRDSKRSIDRAELVDIYSLGALLFFLVTGQAPTKAPERKLREYSDRCPVRLRRIILKCLEDNPANRYQSSTILAQELAAYRYQRYPWLSPAIGVASVALLITSASWLWFSPAQGSTPALINSNESATQASHQSRAHSLYSEQLKQQSQEPAARRQARVAIDYYKLALTQENADLTLARYMVDFVQQQTNLFNQSEMTAILLDSVALLEGLNGSYRSHILNVSIARLYKTLATLHANQGHLKQRWLEAAREAVDTAVAANPSSERYQKLRCELYQLNGGTC